MAEGCWIWGNGWPIARRGLAHKNLTKNVKLFIFAGGGRDKHYAVWCGAVPEDGIEVGAGSEDGRCCGGETNVFILKLLLPFILQTLKQATQKFA